MSPLIIWLITGIILGIAEIFTATFYLACIAIGAFAVVIIELLVPFKGESYITSGQLLFEGILCAIVSIGTMFFIPKWMNRKKGIPTTFESEIGETVKVQTKKNGEHFIKIQGQKWGIDHEDGFNDKEKVKITGFKGNRAIVEKV